RPFAVAKVVTRRPRAWLADRTLGIVQQGPEVQANLLYQASAIASARYRGRPFAGPALVVVAGGGPAGRRGEEAWSPWLQGPVRYVTVPGDHYSLLQEPNVAELAEHVAAARRRPVSP